MPTVIYQGASWTYEEITKNGLVWMDRNLGATQAASAFNDTASYGHLFQWGRGDDGSQLRNSGTTGTQYTDDAAGSLFVVGFDDWRNPPKDELWNNELNIPIPTGWRLPTRDEMDTERASWATDNYDGAFGSTLKWTTGGLRNNGDGSITFDGSVGYYWSSTINGAYSRWLRFDDSYSGTSFYMRANGASVRLIKVSAATPTPYPLPAFYPTY